MSSDCCCPYYNCNGSSAQEGRWSLSPSAALAVTSRRGHPLPTMLFSCFPCKQGVPYHFPSCTQWLPCMHKAKHPQGVGEHTSRTMEHISRERCNYRERPPQASYFCSLQGWLLLAAGKPCGHLGLQSPSVLTPPRVGVEFPPAATCW